MNTRPSDDPRGCCTERGAAEVFDVLREKVYDSELRGKVRINATGCLNQCAQGPSVVVYPEGVWYGGLNRTTAEQIFEEHLIEGQPVIPQRTEE